MKGFRTLIFNAVIALVGVIEVFDWAEVVPNAWMPLVLILVSASGVYLRKITDSPIGEDF